jgi:site-specific DNA recombinase
VRVQHDMPRNTVNPRLAIAYLRVSTEEQRLGPEAQRASIEAWAAKEGVTIVAWGVDQGVSGGDSIEDRRGLVEALASMKVHQAGLFVVAKRDRLARDVYIAATIERAVAATGARVVTSDGTANGDTPADAFMRSILDAVAQYERAMIRARVKAALAVKQARGELTGAAPYGFSVAEDGVRLVPNKSEQAVVAVVKMARERGLTQRGIVNHLYELGFMSRSGRPFSKTQVVRMLERAA